MPEEDESGAESDVSGGAGSTGALDRTEEDFTRDEARSTGFVGKSSEITWLQRLRQRNKDGNESGWVSPSPSDFGSKRATDDSFNAPAEADSAHSVHEFSYHLDDEAITTFEHIDPYAVPTAEIAHNLFSAYFTRVHPTYPILGRRILTAQFQKFESGQAQRPPKKWLAILNLIFAIAARYSHLIQANWEEDEGDHSIYFTRARLLSVNSEAVFQHPDLQMIQIYGLISFYFLCISQMNRAWSIAGIAIRWANALGLNMRNDSPTLKDSLKEIRYRVWWALYTLEHRLCSMTGRVNCIRDDQCTTPLPVPMDEDKFESQEGSTLLSKEQQQGSRAPFFYSHSPSSSGSRSRLATKPTGTARPRSPSSMAPTSTLDFAKDVPACTSLYFLHLVQLTRLTQSIFHQLYNPTALQGTWTEVQDTIHLLSEQLNAWYLSLPSMFDFRWKQRNRDFHEFRLSLGFCYYGTKIMVYRPCLCRLDRRVPHQSSKLLEFNRQAVTACVDAARDILNLIPDEPNAVGLMRVSPWWCVPHWLVQACTVLMLEISFQAHHMPEEVDAVLQASKKGVRWLHALGEDNLSAKRAWGLCNAMLHEAVRKIGRDVSDLPQRPPERKSSLETPGYGQALPRMQNCSVPGPTSSPMMGGAYPAFANLDQLMQYDQYFPCDQNMVDGINMPSDTEMEFMSDAYHEDHGQQVDGLCN